MTERPEYSDSDEMRRRCAAHHQWIVSHPEGAAFAEYWADQALALVGGL
ncbi:hypothetical protein [Mycobacterium sp. 48b]